MKYTIHLLLFSLLFMSCAAENQKQNFVFILVDDLGWTDLSYSGSTFHETPNIDSLSRRSILFTNAYSSGSVCSPSRAAIMTGQHPARVNITDWIPGDHPLDEPLLGPVDLNELPLKENTISEVLSDNGYRTFFAGKWHLGSEGYYPENQGFDINMGGHEMGQPPAGYYSPYKNPRLTDGEHLTDRLTDESIQFLDEVKDESFFLMLSYYTVHTPIQACKRHIDKFNKKLASLENKEIAVKEDGSGKTTLDQKNPAYASMLYALDENIGRLITHLKKRDLYDNTTIIFTSDNGGLYILKKTYRSTAPTSVVPLRGGKGWLYEGGIRVPLLIKPAKYSSNSRVIDVPVIGHDFYPTLLSLAGIETGSEIVVDGVDLSPMLNGNSKLDRKELYWHYPHYHGSAWAPGAAIRQGDWKLIEFFESKSTELYNLADDISETVDLSTKYPDRVVTLKSKLHHLQQSMNANEAVVNPDFVTQ